jgi:carboxymethylenebutenolidase
MNVKEQFIEINGADHYLARAVRPTSAGMLLLPTVSGIDAFARGVADAFAGHGLTTIVWNPYPEVPVGTAAAEVRQLAERLTDAIAVRNITGCVDAFDSLGVNAIATIGFCMGGRFALVCAARERRLRAAVAAYPSIHAEAKKHQEVDAVAASATIGCPVQVLYPGRDHVTPRPVFDALQAALQSRSAETSILFYPEAEHGFFHKPSAVNDAAARSARPQIAGFLESRLA